MKKSILLAGALCFAILANAQKVQQKDIPAAVKATLQKHYPQAAKVKWEKENNNYEAGFELQNVEYSLLIDVSGNIVETETEIAVSSLPKAITAYVSQKYPGQQIKEAAKITDAKGVITYEAEIKDQDLIFDAAGHFIKASKD